jgi:rSAM/selenodomain-associated transferase 2/rSAM/selenodomain-associated transferase 1
MIVYFAGGDHERMRDLFGDDITYRPQQGRDLGQRLIHAIEESFAAGAGQVLVIGTDAPELTPAILQQATAALEEHDLVVGPAIDGGYYLIGLTRCEPKLFQDIAWGTAAVLAQTLTAAHRLGFHVHRLPPLSDVDHPEDLLVCRRLGAGFDQSLPTRQTGLLSIIIPTLNESATLAATLDRMVAVPDIEIIIVDGGSEDQTVQIARAAGATVIASRPGRGRQLNAGASLASGENLLFLHADTQLPSDFRPQIFAALASGAAAGAFSLKLADSRFAFRWIEWGVNLRSRWLQMPYGDQGIFLAADRFYQLGGFPSLPLMEDFEFCRQLRKQGRIVLLPSAVTTSARRWQRLGIVRTTIINQACIVGYLLGISPQRLARWYASRRGPW